MSLASELNEFIYINSLNSEAEDISIETYI